MTDEQPDAETDRQVQPVDAELPPRLPFPVVGIGASAGGLEAVGEFLDAMPADTGMAFVLVQHLPPDRDSLMAEILSRRTAMPVREVGDGLAVEPDRVYVIRPGYRLTIADGRLRLGPPLGSPRAANRPIDDFFKSLAEEQRERAVCVVMSGMGSNGTAGAQAVKAVGGLCVAQDPESAQYPSMPRHLIDAGYADFVLRPADMPAALRAYARDPYARGAREADADEALRRDGQHLREILAVLRTRTRQDFGGYKKPTVLRRVQRRMGLTQVPSVGEYARVLRQSPTEVAALADDLLIHVTGFFRDREAWAALHEKVIGPLVAGRESGASVRGWVTACSSGEEAYSLAMLLVEEAERIGKQLDVKVFATDLAERSLAHARAGVYPGGIESEIPPERLSRFFTPDGEMYRVRSDLRDRVVFAPQNVLQDPPFSRIDVASCRNLLIYLEPDVQQRVLRLLHFGLREGGALFLGSAETVAGADDLFEPIDKKARIFKRIGPTRHGAVDFPLPHALHPGDDGLPLATARAWPRRPDGPRPSLAQLTQRALLDAHTPPAVTVDRDGRVVYYHGDTRPFLQQLSGEPTRDLLLLAREGVRGAVRVALQRAAAQARRAVAPDGWADLDNGHRARVVVVASPVPADPPGEERPAPSDYFVVSFENHGEVAAPSAVAEPGAETADELRRLRSELQSTIEELQTSNEELKASHEEVTSVNEELQSANEELETSKEEMQSLNEELTTVNAQLRAKMEEHQAASSDLSSLLSSTDIAVLFLDTSFRIRRYTPAFRNLVDLIAADVGRPLAALARKFDDPHLDADCRGVLERLTPAEREVSSSAGGRHYLRRATPYRTTDNRINGVVVTFVDITGRKRAEDALREHGGWLRGQRAALEAALNGAPLEASLGALVRTAADALGEGTRAAVYLADAGGVKLRHVVGMPAEYAAAVDGFRIGPESLACGLATHIGAPVLTADVATDPRWEPWREMAARFDYRGCWSFPIHSAAGHFVGTLAVYSRRPREATGQDQELGALLTHTASIIISRHTEAEARRRAEAALRENEERYRAIASNLPNGALFVIGPDLRYQLADGEALRAAGFAPADLEGKTVAEAVGPGLAADYEANYRRVLAGEPFRAEHASHDRHFVTHGVPLRGADGRTTAALAVSYDITDRVRAEDAVRAGEERLRQTLAAATDYAIFTLAPDRAVTSWSPGAEAVFGYAADEIIGRTADALFTPEDRAAGAPAAEADEARRTGRASDERWHRRKGGERFFASGVLSRLGESGADGFVKVLRDLTDRKRAEDELRTARAHLEARVAERTAELGRALESLETEMARRTELARRLATAQEDERRRVARDLHDSVGQTLTGLSLAAAGGRAEQVRQLADALARELHEVAVRLRPTALDDAGLAAASQALAEGWSRRTGVPVEFQAVGLDAGRLPPEVETTLFRAIQEALTNIAKHAGAARVSVVVGTRGAEAVAVVEDDGAGFDPEVAVTPPPGRPGGLGLAGMRERVKLIGGAVEVESAPGRGTTVIARIPLPARP